MNKQEALAELRSGILVNFISPGQRAVMATVVKGEEGQFVIEKIAELKKIIETMPKPYGTDGFGTDSIAHLHYFGGSVDAWITERDATDDQIQAFGRICLTGRSEDRELGYICIHELIDNGIELDLYWTPKALKDI